MVPPNWEHPKDESGRDKPMYDERFEDAAAKWKKDFAAWEAGERPNYFSELEDGKLEYWEWEVGPPDREYYRPWKDEEATWFQVWQTVSEGSPVTPPFATKPELVEYLVAHGDFWDQKRGDGPWSRKSAESFVLGVGWAPTLMQVDGQVVEARDVAAVLEARNEA